MSNNTQFLLDELENSNSTGYWEYDAINNKLFWSKQTCRIHKVPPGTIPDVASGINYYHEEDRDLIADLFGRCVSQGAEFRKNLRILNSEGEIVPVEAFGKPIYDDNKKIIGAFGTFQDLSQIEKIKNEKRASDNQLYQFKKNLFEFSIVAETDVKGIITNVNERFCEISGYTREELIGQSHKMINSNFHPPEFFQKMWETISSGDPWRGLICNQAKNGDRYWVESFIYPNYNLKREIIGYSAIRFDVTDRINMQEELVEERQKANFMSQLASIGEISANIAHEIKNPLAVIQANMSILPRIIENPEKVKKVQVLIDKSTHRINNIVKGLQKLSYKSKEDEFEEFNFKELFLETIDFCNEALRFHNIVINYDQSLEDIFVFGHEIKISQILLNLINNAKDAIVDANTDERWINIDVQNRDGYIKISVIDSGPGVSDEHKNKIMESFFTTKSKGKGTGLGLNLIRTFIGEHDGEFYLDPSAEDTTFVITLPKNIKANKMLG